MGVLFYAGRGLTKVDVNAYRSAAEGPCNDEEDFHEIVEREDLISVEYNEERPELSDGLERDATYRCEETVFFSFPHWRVCRDWVQLLRKLVGYTDEEILAEGSTVDFREYFLWYQEGTIGPLAAARIAAQFAKWDERAKVFGAQFADGSERALAEQWFYNIYEDMRDMFEWTSKDGIVFLRSA
ncbi:hypothetical protein [Paraburkholderia tropica]|uniref:hypothetical protein n=1 Tax=Paraburkholderia tropica TaxID=92647 RepID=UPI002ABDAE35|nr:hypothetical protein [Paraburkholderia tropica]